MNVDLYFFFFQAEDGIRDLVRSRGLGDVYKRQRVHRALEATGDRQYRPAASGLGRCAAAEPDHSRDERLKRPSRSYRMGLG